MSVDDKAALLRRVAFWRAAAIGFTALAAAGLAAVVLIAARPGIVSPAPELPPLLNASLMGPKSAERPMYLAAYDAGRHVLIVTSLTKAEAAPGRVDELWVIPADGKPHPIGAIPPGESKALPIPHHMTRLFAPGSTIAVSVEPPGGAPTKEGPSGPIAAVGRLARL